LDAIRFEPATPDDHRCRFDSETAITRIMFHSPDKAWEYVNVCARHLDELATVVLAEQAMWAMRSREIAEGRNVA
jgi:hypothetical protein